MLEMLYALIVEPLKMMLEFLFDNIYDASGNIGITILLMSFIVSLICLPLYLKADLLQEEENETQKKLKPRVDVIKKNYKGDERHLLLQTYYRQNNYHPIMALRLALSLLLQIPIFIAAYTFFSHLSILNGMSYCIFDNLTKPDGLLKLGQFEINILPILMTVVNLLAGFVYSKDKGLGKNKVLIVMSLFFLVLLYNSPSALVLYWLFNNLFSLLKNICLVRMSHEKFIKYAVLCALGVYYLFTLIYSLSGVFLLLIIAILILKQKGVFNKFYFDFSVADGKLFALTLLGIVFLLGGLIPSNVIATSPLEFVFFELTPIQLLSHTFLVFVGYGLWSVCIYYLINNKSKQIFTVLICLFLFASLVNMLMQKMPLVTLSNIFTFETALVYFNPFLNTANLLRTIVLFLVLSSVLFVIVKNKRYIINRAILLIIVSSLVISFYNIGTIIKSSIGLNNTLNQQFDFDSKYINLSKTDKNILIIFVDRAINSYLPIAFKEFPDLFKQFEGFTYYPNTLSYSGYTILGYLPILGGYEYTPFEMDKRAGLFENKFKESTTMLPAIFSQNGWTSSIINPTAECGQRANEGSSKKQITNLINNKFLEEFEILYKIIPDSISRDLQQRVKLVRGSFAKRNSVYYSLLSGSTPEVRNFLYEKGMYHNPENEVVYSQEFLKNYSELYYLPKLTGFSGQGNTFTVFNNSLPHFSTRLNYPNYDISEKSQEDYSCPMQINDNSWSLKHYHVNVAMLKMLGVYFDYLRQNDVFDNTRIIVVADHGYKVGNPDLGQFESEIYLPYNPLLLVKDFGSNGELKIINEVMTNADVPLIATSGVVKNPINPFTNKSLKDSDKQKGILIKQDTKWQPVHYLGKEKILVGSDKFLYVKGDPLNHQNWKFNLSYEEALKLSK